MNTDVAIKNVFSEHEAFIVIGLTGRTGSGCSTVADILATDSFDELHLQTPKTHDYQYNYERKERVIYNYAKEHWKSGFKVLSMTDIICSYVIEAGSKTLLEYINKMERISGKDKIIKEINGNKEKIDDLASAIKESVLDDTDSDVFDVLMRINEFRSKAKELLSNSTIEYETNGRKDAKDQAICGEGKDKEVQIASTYTFLLQTFGNNLRSSGNPFDDSTFDGEHIFCLAERANTYIKKHRKKYKSLPTMVVLDAIRNPYEAQFFRNRYAGFYLVSVNTEEDERLRRLSHLNKEQIKSLDEIEYPKKLDGSNQFSNQNIAACIQAADIHIYNPHCEINEKFFLTKQIVRFIMLMKHPGLVSPSHVERCMQLAYTAKLNSGCISRQVGAIITDQDFSVKAVGWNDVPKGQVPCSLRDVQTLCSEKDSSSYSKFELSDSKFGKAVQLIANKEKDCDLCGRLHPYCFKDIYGKITKQKNQVHTRSLHAEENAFLQLSKYSGGGIKNGYLFTSASPCELCSKKAYQLGIKRIYYIDPYPGISAKHILSFGNGTSDPEMKLFYGAIGRAYINLYMQNIPIKDELESIVGDLSVLDENN